MVCSSLDGPFEPVSISGKGFALPFGLIFWSDSILIILIELFRQDYVALSAFGVELREYPLH